MKGDLVKVGVLRLFPTFSRTGGLSGLVVEEVRSMKRNVILCAVAVALLAAIPGWAAPPFGSFDDIVGGGNAGAGLLPLTGWTLDDNGVLAVDILVDGGVAGRAAYGRARAGV